MLRYSCPATGRMVITSIETTKETLKRLGGFRISVWCPHCQTGHKISGQDAIAVETAAA